MTVTALLGGSFNPPHVAHQMACLLVLETAGADEVWMVPTYRHAFGKELAPFSDRAAMCERAAAAFAGRVSVCAIEAELGAETSRTYDTLVELGRREPSRRFRLVIGSDILREVDKWHRWSDVERIGEPIVLARPGYPHPRARPPALPEVSATAIREAIAAGGAPASVVPARVWEYIRDRELYR